MNQRESSRHQTGLSPRTPSTVSAPRIDRLSIDCEGSMDYRSPLQHLLHSLLPSRGPADQADAARDFADTEPVDEHAAAVQASRRQAMRDEPWRAAGWAESALDLADGTEIMEYPDDTAADLMDEYFAQSDQRRRAC